MYKSHVSELLSCSDISDMSSSIWCVFIDNRSMLYWWHWLIQYIYFYRILIISSEIMITKESLTMYVVISARSFVISPQNIQQNYFISFWVSSERYPSDQITDSITIIFYTGILSEEASLLLCHYILI